MAAGEELVHRVSWQTARASIRAGQSYSDTQKERRLLAQFDWIVVLASLP